MKKFIGIVLLATTISVPAFAQSFDPENGTGNLVTENTIVPAPAPMHSRTISRHAGEDAYAMSVRRKIDSNPVYLNSDNNTGGGSAGYNEMLRRW